MNNRSAVHVVTGGQFGSEAKGAVTAALVRRMRHDNPQRQVTNVRVAGPNAGHTAYDAQGRAWALRQIPQCAVIADSLVLLAIAPGSEVDLRVLYDEVHRLEAAGLPVMDRLAVSADATLLTDVHHERERQIDLSGRIGSTGKGIGAARADRILRTAMTLRVMEHPYPARKLDEAYPGLSDQINADGMFDSLTDFLRQLWLVPDGHTWTSLLEEGDVVVEGTQGYGLGLHTKFYPTVTSSDCTALNWLQMAGIVPWASWVGDIRVWVVLRPYPIRVAGNSGPLLGETTWEQLGLPAEQTTVTHKTRRVGGWDARLAHDAVAANGGGLSNTNVVVAFTMADQVVPELAGRTSTDGLAEDAREALDGWVRRIQDSTGARVAYVGTGPNSYIWQDPEGVF